MLFIFDLCKYLQMGLVEENAVVKYTTISVPRFNLKILFSLNKSPLFSLFTLVTHVMFSPRLLKATALYRLYSGWL